MKVVLTSHIYAAQYNHVKLRHLAQHVSLIVAAPSHWHTALFPHQSAQTAGDYHLTLGNLYEVLGDTEGAEIAYSNAIRSDPNNALYQGFYGNFYLKKGDTQKTITAYKKALQVYPGDLDKILNECYIIISVSSEPGARQESFLSIAREICSQNVSSYVTLAQFCIDKGWHDAAASVYQQAIAKRGTGEN